MTVDLETSIATSGEPIMGPETVIRDYRIAYRSRQASLLGRKEVLSGKAKFGIFGDGKELPQVALAHAFRPGDWRSGYYRDQTIMFALGLLSVEEFFAQLYAHPDLKADPSSGGRQMNAHFATRTVDSQGNFLDLKNRYNSSADGSPTGSQMPRLLGLAEASKHYRRRPELGGDLSQAGNEIAFGTIGNASCAEGMLWESINAACVLQVPMLLSIWDDGYGISVPNQYQIAKSDLSELLSGFRRTEEKSQGLELFTVEGWDYPALVEAYLAAAEIVRREHVPVVVHVINLTQPQGHSTSGSHERYKSAERLRWEVEADGISRMRQWMISVGIATEDEMNRWEEEDSSLVKEAQQAAWAAFRESLTQGKARLEALIDSTEDQGISVDLASIRDRLARIPNPLRRDLAALAHDAQVVLRQEDPSIRAPWVDFYREMIAEGRELYSSHLHGEHPNSTLQVSAIPVAYEAKVSTLNAFELLNRYFDTLLKTTPNVVAFGEDVGYLGDVNQGFSGLQDKHGDHRVYDTGIRECTIMGQAIGLALRGFRPIAEIQYLDYVLYGLQILSDDVATLRYRTFGGQKAPIIVRTRGHRLEGIWHSGSPMAGIINLLRGVHICVPRDMTRAVGLYNTLLAGDDPALVVEVLNGYRSKEKLPANLTDFRIALGVPELLRPGTDVTLVTYGACCRIAMAAADQLETLGASVEVIDVQTLLPFDREGRILESIKKTSLVVFLDEDVPGGATAFMMQQVLEQGAFSWLDASPLCISAESHRPAYGSDGDYWSKPQREGVVRKVYNLLSEADATRFPALWS